MEKLKKKYEESHWFVKYLMHMIPAMALMGIALLMFSEATTDFLHPDSILYKFVYIPKPDEIPFILIIAFCGITAYILK